MIRRSPTRIELKLEDLNDFDYIQKFDKKKNAVGTVVSSAEAQKLLRQERIGLGQLGFRPIRSSSNVGGNNSASQQVSITSPPEIATPAGNGGINPSAVVTPTTPSINDTPVDMNVNNNSSNDDLNLIIEEDGIHANNSTMSFDESL